MKDIDWVWLVRIDNRYISEYGNKVESPDNAKRFTTCGDATKWAFDIVQADTQHPCTPIEALVGTNGSILAVADKS